MPRRRFHIDEHGSLRSGWLTNADPDREPDEADTPAPPNADGGARSDRRPPEKPDMAAMLRSLARTGSTENWPNFRSE